MPWPMSLILMSQVPSQSLDQAFVLKHNYSLIEFISIESNVSRRRDVQCLYITYTYNDAMYAGDTETCDLYLPGMEFG